MNTESLPVEIEPLEPLRCWWLPIGAAFSIVLIANSALLFLGVRHHNRQEGRLLQAKWSLAGDSQRSFDWIVVGDSSGAFGVDPAILSQELSGSCVNLCTFGSMGIAGDAWMLERYLVNHRPPQGVIIVHAADVWAGGQGDAFYQYAAAVPVPTSSLLGHLICLGSRPSELFITLRYRDWFPLLLLKDYLRDRVGWLSTEQHSLEPPLSLPPDGASRLPASDARPEAVLEQSATYLSATPDNRSFDLRYRWSLNRIVELAGKHRVSVYLANGPIAKPALQSPQFEKSLHPAAQHLSMLADVQPKLFYVLRDYVAFAPEVMQNCNHVVGPAVDEYTRALAAAILTTSP